MTLAIFDLDNTLLDGDSDYLWGDFLVKQGLVDQQAYEQANQYFYAQYNAGTLDIHEYAAFSMRFLAENTLERLSELHQIFMQQVILAKIPDQSRNLVNKHKKLGHTVMIITATNSFITGPIAKALGVEILIAIEPKRDGDTFIAEIDGIPSFQAGKVQRLENWLKLNPKYNLQGSFFYSDSHNDIPLLKMVDFPITVNPDDKLAQTARQAHWPILYLHR